MAHREITSELFDGLLEWLGPTRDDGARTYEDIRNRLIRILLKKGCSDPEGLTDETVNRVITKLPQIRDGYVGNPLWYFVSVARRVWRESLRAREIPYETVPETIVLPQADFGRECLQQCLALLPVDQRDFVLDYHLNRKREKIDLHHKMAEELGLSLNALRLRAHRIRVVLEKCVLECFEGKTK